MHRRRVRRRGGEEARSGQWTADSAESVARMRAVGAGVTRSPHVTP